MRITEIWFDADYIYGKDEEGIEYKQSLLWYPKLRQASDEERSKYTFGFDGIHWTKTSASRVLNTKMQSRVLSNVFF